VTVVTPAELRRSNIEHFRLLLERTRDAAERSRIERLLQEERLKPDDAYPSPVRGTRRQ
jgi:hypothetical protein